MSDSFQSSESVLCKKPILNTPTQTGHTLFTDESNYAFSSIHTQAVSDPDDLRPIAYTSGSFSNMQQRWPATEKEAFAVYQSILKFDLYLREA